MTEHDKDIDYVSDKEYANDFLSFLLKFKRNDDIYTNQDTVDVLTKIKKSITSPDFLRFSTFKALVCELFHNAINSIPSIITEYTITCKNNKGINQIIIGVLDDIDDEGEISVAKVITPDSIFIMNKLHVNNFYIANKTNFYDHEIVDSVFVLLYNNGNEPSITTSYKVAKRLTKE